MGGGVGGATHQILFLGFRFRFSVVISFIGASPEECFPLPPPPGLLHPGLHHSLSFSRCPTSQYTQHVSLSSFQPLKALQTGTTVMQLCSWIK